MKKSRINITEVKKKCKQLLPNKRHHKYHQSCANSMFHCRCFKHQKYITAEKNTSSILYTSVQYKYMQAY